MNLNYLTSGAFQLHEFGIDLSVAPQPWQPISMLQLLYGLSQTQDKECCAHEKLVKASSAFLEGMRQDMHHFHPSQQVEGFVVVS